ncbi:MAG: membrane protein insertase YidC [Rhodospirillales bacterium]|nr:membrane protein insertase YidC [Rhodospirillales bacterium]
MTEEHRNMLLAVVLSVAILLGFELFFSKKRDPVPPESASSGTEQMPAPGAPTSAKPSAEAPTGGRGAVAPTAPGMSATVAGAAPSSRKLALGKSPRIKVVSPRLNGSISLAGGDIDDLLLIDYREELDPDSPEIVLLSPSGAPKAYYARFGWVGADGVRVPDADTLWRADGTTLEPGRPVTLRWENGAGLRFTRTLALDENYMFTVTQRAENDGAEAVKLLPYGLISRRGTPDVTGFYILHEGLLGVFDDTLKEVDYDELQETGVVQQSSRGGWIGITDKYWLAALVPDQKALAKTRFVHRRDDSVDMYQVDFLGEQMELAPGATVETKSHVFAGAKEVALLDGYESELGIARFDLAIDFGWFYFLTKPIFYVLIYINDRVGNYGVAILLLTVLIKLIFFPLANKSYKSMSKMKKLQPEVIKLREQFGEDKARLNQEMMALYKREKANPASGCLPIVVQIPVFFALYKVLFVTIEMRHAPFFGWIQDLSAPDPTSVFNLFGLVPVNLPDFLMIGVWPLLMGLTMFLQQKLNPQPADPMQAKIFMFLPIMFTFLLARFPAGLVIYWAWNNLLSIIQQKVIMVRMGVK